MSLRHRNDGWTVEKQYAFIEALAEQPRARTHGIAAFAAFRGRRTLVVTTNIREHSRLSPLPGRERLGVGASASALCYADVMRRADPACPKGLRQFLDPEQQRAWLEGEATPPDIDERTQPLEQRFKYTARFEKLLRRPQAQDVLEILRLYGATSIPIPRRTERTYWSVSCLPGSPDKPLVRISASFMELFALHADGYDLRARFILHLSDFTADASPDPDQVDTDQLESLVEQPEDVTHAVWRNGREILIAKVRTAASIRKFLTDPRALRAIRNFNLTHMNRGRNAYQASHCYSVADVMLGD